MTTTFSWGSPEENWSKLPNALIGELDKIDSLAELKVILYVLRHTWGYGDKVKKITTNEFENGRKRKDSTRIDNGVGMALQSIRDGLGKAIADGYLCCLLDTSDLARQTKYYFLSGTDTEEFQNLRKDLFLIDASNVATWKKDLAESKGLDSLTQWGPDSDPNAPKKKKQQQQDGEVDADARGLDSSPLDNESSPPGEGKLDPSATVSRPRTEKETNKKETSEKETKGGEEAPAAVGQTPAPLLISSSDEEEFSNAHLPAVATLEMETQTLTVIADAGLKPGEYIPGMAMPPRRSEQTRALKANTKADDAIIDPRLITALANKYLDLTGQREFVDENPNDADAEKCLREAREIAKFAISKSDRFRTAAALEGIYLEFKALNTWCKGTPPAGKLKQQIQDMANPDYVPAAQRAATDKNHGAPVVRSGKTEQDWAVLKGDAESGVDIWGLSTQDSQGALQVA